MVVAPNGVIDAGIPTFVSSDYVISGGDGGGNDGGGDDEEEYMKSHVIDQS